LEIFFKKNLTLKTMVSILIIRNTILGKLVGLLIRPKGQ